MAYYINTSSNKKNCELSFMKAQVRLEFANAKCRAFKRNAPDVDAEEYLHHAVFAVPSVECAQEVLDAAQLSRVAELQEAAQRAVVLGRTTMFDVSPVGRQALQAMQRTFHPGVVGAAVGQVVNRFSRVLWCGTVYRVGEFVLVSKIHPFRDDSVVWCCEIKELLWVCDGVRPLVFFRGAFHGFSGVPSANNGAMRVHRVPAAGGGASDFRPVCEILRKVMLFDHDDGEFCNVVDFAKPSIHGQSCVPPLGITVYAVEGDDCVIESGSADVWRGHVLARNRHVIRCTYVLTVW